MTNEALWRGGVFFLAFAVLAFLEFLAPDRRMELRRLDRWPGTAGLLVVSIFVLRLLLPFGLAGIALFAKTQGWGVFNHLELPLWAEVVIVILVFDLAIWSQHLLMHLVPYLWPLHRVHHTDPDIDVMTALRFHPLEIAVSGVWKALITLMLGPAILAVLVYEILLNTAALFNHANIRLPRKVDSLLRLIIVTPAMHRVHHSVHRLESDSNFGNFLSIWDRLFGFYAEQLREGAATAQLGQSYWRDEDAQSLRHILIQPARIPATEHAVEK